MRYKQGLRSEFEEEFERDEPNTFVEAVRVAERAERIWKRKSHTTKPGGECPATWLDDKRSTDELNDKDTPPTVRDIRRLEVTHSTRSTAREREEERPTEKAGYRKCGEVFETG